MFYTVLEGSLFSRNGFCNVFEDLSTKAWCLNYGSAPVARLFLDQTCIRATTFEIKCDGGSHVERPEHKSVGVLHIFDTFIQG